MIITPTSIHDIYCLQFGDVTPSIEKLEYHTKSIPKFESPQKLLEFMSDIEYGWADKNYKVYKNFGGEFSDNFRMLLPHEVVQYKTGVCWDQSVFEKYVFDTQFNFDEVVLMANQMYYLGTHTYLCYRDGKDWYYFEHSWGNYAGIHGPFKSVKDINDLVRKWQAQFHGKDMGALFTNITNEDLYRKHTCDQFMTLCKFDFSRAGALVESVYHYCYNGAMIDTILAEGLKPVNLTRDPKELARYSERVEGGNPDEYFRNTYKQFYEKALNRPYKNYGIYMTTVDLGSIDPKIAFRIDVPLTSFDQSNTVIQLGAKVEKFTMKGWDRISREFADPKVVKKIYDSSKLKFKQLPQIVCFDDVIKIEKNHIIPLT